MKTKEDEVVDAEKAVWDNTDEKKMNWLLIPYQD